MMLLLHLSWPQIKIGETIGPIRHNSSRSKGQQNSRGLKGEGIFEDYWGAMGEVAASVAVGEDPADLLLKIDTYTRKKDVDDFDVRTATSHRGRLLIHKKDPDDRKVLLVTVHPPFRTTSCKPTTDFIIQGYYRAGEAKKHPEWYTNLGHEDREWVWAVPQKHLLGSRI